MRLQHKTWLWLVLAVLVLIANFVLAHVFNIYDGSKHLLTIVTFAIILWICCRIIKAVECYYIRSVPQDFSNYSFQVSGIKALSRLAQVIALFIFIVIVLGLLQIPMSGLITVGGVGGLAMAYAGKDTFNNFLGGIMVYMNRQFAIGDHISSPDRDIAGKVEIMGWQYTLIRRAAGESMYVPNSVFSSILLVNTSRLKKTQEKPKK